MLAIKTWFSLKGCTDDDGSFYAGGQTWSLPDCGRGVCAKSLKGGWQVSHERYIQ